MSHKLTSAAYIAIAFVITAVAAPASADAPKTEDHLSLAYYGEAFSHPGFTVGFQPQLSTGPIHLMWVGPELGFYVHPKNHVALWAEVQFGNRLTDPRGFFGELVVSVGYLHTWVDGPVYSYDDSQDVVKLENRGWPHLRPSFSFGLGHDFSVSHNAPVAWFLRLNVFAELPFNYASLTHLSIHSGLVIRLGETT